ncbi:TPA: hypothetical protein ACPZLP_004694, partial [Yersinia enterocolitica]
MGFVASSALPPGLSPFLSPWFGWCWLVGCYHILLFYFSSKHSTILKCFNECHANLNYFGFKVFNLFHFRHHFHKWKIDTPITKMGHRIAAGTAHAELIFLLLSSAQEK